MPGFQLAKAMVSTFRSLQSNSQNLQVYAGIFPVDTSDFIKLEESVKRVRKCLLHFSHHLSRSARPANPY